MADFKRVPLLIVINDIKWFVMIQALYLIAQTPKA